MIYFAYAVFAFHCLMLSILTASLQCLELKEARRTAFAVFLMQIADVSVLAFLLLDQ